MRISYRLQNERNCHAGKVLGEASLSAECAPMRLCWYFVDLVVGDLRPDVAVALEFNPVAVAPW